MNLQQARTAGEQAGQMCLAFTEAEDSTFSERAARHILLSLRHLQRATGEALTDLCKRDGLVPHDDRAFGPIYARLSKDGRIRRAGWAPRIKGHGTGGATIWELVA